MSKGPEKPERIELPERRGRPRAQAQASPPKLELQLEGRSLPLTSTTSRPRRLSVPVRPTSNVPDELPLDLPPLPPPPLTEDRLARAESAEQPLEDLVPSHMQRDFYRSAEHPPEAEEDEAIDLGEPTVHVPVEEEEPEPRRRIPLWAAVLMVGLLLLAAWRLTGPRTSSSEPAPESVALSEVVPSPASNPAVSELDSLPLPPIAEVPVTEIPAGTSPDGSDVVLESAVPDDSVPMPLIPAPVKKADPASPDDADGTVIGETSGDELEMLEQPPDPMAGEEEVVVESEPDDIALQSQGPRFPDPMESEQPAEVEPPTSAPVPASLLEVQVQKVPGDARVVLFQGDSRYEHTGPGDARLQPKEPGEYTLKVSAPGYKVFQKTLRVEGQHNLAVHLEPIPRPVAPPPPRYSAPVSRPYYPPPPRRPSGGGGQYDISSPSY